MLPDYYQELSIIGANSKMVIDVLTKQMPIKKDIIVFPNYAPNIYFHNKIKKVEKIIKICIVSNHVPKELNDFQKIAITNGIKVDIYGIGNIEKYVDNNVLSEYDLIISIGKTIYYALAMGKLAYCYDRFGGYGFINSKNIDECFQKNFSGKGLGKFLTGQEIYNDIIENFKNTNKCLKKMQEYAFSYFNFENNIKKILNSLTVSNKVNCSNLIKKYSMLEIKAKLYVESINIKNNIINEKNNIINAQNENLKSIYQSTSWKLTVPIRYMKKIIYKLLNK